MSVLDVVTQPTVTRPAIDMPTDVRSHLQSNRTRAALRIQHGVLQAVRQRLTDAGFVELHAPMIGPVTDPGVRGAKQIDVDYYGRRYKMMTSAILYKQAALLSFDRILCVAPNVRLEPPQTRTTGRHLVEFHQIDVEVADASREDVMDLARELLVAAVDTARTRHADDLTTLGRDPDAFDPVLDRPFRAVSHAEAIAALEDRQLAPNSSAEIDWRGEELLSLESDVPFFVTDYPKGSRGFYDRESTSTPGVLRNFDLIAPEGYGELASGGEREHEYARVLTRMRETGENPGKYGWYLDLVRDGVRPSAGFGLGVERLTRYVAGIDAVWQASAFPKLPGELTP